MKKIILLSCFIAMHLSINAMWMSVGLGTAKTMKEDRDKETQQYGLTAEEVEGFDLQKRHARLMGLKPAQTMEGTINYEHFFELCKRGKVEAVKNFIQQNPTININYQTKDHGTTAVLHAAIWWKWDAVWYLLQCGADKMITDNYGQSLLLKSLGITYVKGFEKLLRLYSHEEINALCKSMSLERNRQYKIYDTIDKRVQDVLDRKKELEDKDHPGDTALRVACTYDQIPIIVELLNRGADLESKNYGIPTYAHLNRSKHRLFVVREALNNGPCIPVEELSIVLDNAVGADCAGLVKQRYIEEKLKEINFFETAQARIWKYVCADACKVAGIERLDEKTNQPDEKRSLAALLLLPQKTLTEVNIQLALEGK